MSRAPERLHGDSEPAVLTFPSARADTPEVIAVSRAWLYVRSRESVRILVDGANVAVYGPGAHFSHSRFQDEMDAALHQTAIEEALIRDGWTLEQLTTERRSGRDRRVAARGVPDRRRSALHLVRKS